MMNICQSLPANIQPVMPGICMYVEADCLLQLSVVCRGFVAQQLWEHRIESVWPGLISNAATPAKMILICKTSKYTGWSSAPKKWNLNESSQIMEDRFHVFLCKPTIFCGIITVVPTQTLLLWIICLQDCLFHMFVLLCLFHLCSVVFSWFLPYSRKTWSLDIFGRHILLIVSGSSKLCMLVACSVSPKWMNS